MTQDKKDRVSFNYKVETFKMSSVAYNESSRVTFDRSFV